MLFAALFLDGIEQLTKYWTMRIAAPKKRVEGQRAE